MIPVSQTQGIRIAKSHVYFIDHDIFHVLYDANAYLEVDDFKEPQALLEKYTEKKAYRVLVEFPQHTHASPDAKQYAMNNTLPVRAEAVVFKNLAQRIVIRFYLMVKQQPHPVRIFTERQKAIDWLNSID